MQLQKMDGEVPWESPCDFELAVALERLTAQASPGQALSVVFLVDGSGSVTEGDVSLALCSCNNTFPIRQT